MYIEPINLWHRKQIFFFQVYIELIILWHLITSICNRVHWATEVLTCLIEDPQSQVKNQVLARHSHRHLGGLLDPQVV